MLKKEGLVDDSFTKILMSWQLSKEEKGMKNLAQYINRNTFSLEKLKYDKKTKSVMYRSKIAHGKNKKNCEVFSPLEFIADITQHIPEPSFQLVRYYGCYSNRIRGDKSGSRSWSKKIQPRKLQIAR